MNTLQIKYENIAISVSFASDSVWFELADGRSISVPLVWFPRLMNATDEERQD